ncbi:16S rRNA (cytosine(1402)-N(4))-methyltransferase RsmH [Candidatus Saccharibacteria bacterium]|nr:MAG: 16S rRNA (cytosine(1402)-N(4))-methyltransferase RsmH [Candidatus Saccharibacteria bacterium]
MTDPLHHMPVLMSETLQYLDPKPDETYLDLTAGYGGHAGAVRALTNGRAVTLVDRDQMAISQLKERFSDHGAEIIHSDFLSASNQLVQNGRQYDMILADLGVSSPHLNIASRGFAISHDGPLDMRMDQTQAVTAADIVNTYDEEDLVRILRVYGEEPRAKRIAQAIIQQRPLTTTSQLAKIVAQAYRGYSKTHPATRTFQALRIAVNDELRQVEQALPLWIRLLKPGGRLAVISFHSLEDRIVKTILAERAGKRYDAELQLLTKRPVVATKDELVSNPRARSAKLRAAVKIKINERG